MISVLVAAYLIAGILMALWSRPDAIERAEDPGVAGWFVALHVVVLWLPLLVVVIVRGLVRR